MKKNQQDEKKQLNSRNSVFDLVEAIFHEIAFQSHCNENLHDTMNDIESTSDIWELTKLNENAEEINWLLNDSIQLRRDLMNKLKEQYVTNMNYWCALKHSIASWWYINECFQTDTSYARLLKRETDKMISTLAKFLWIDITNCMRCLWDSLLNYNPQ